MSILAAGNWGHQSQGVSPKVMRSIRFQAAQICGRVATGSVEVALEVGCNLVSTSSSVPTVGAQCVALWGQ